MGGMIGAERLSNLHWQFVLAGSGIGVEPPGSWVRCSLGGWELATHQALPVVDLLTENGEHVGWVLGVAIHPREGIVGESQVIPVANIEALSGEVVERVVYEWGGRFAVVVIAGEMQRLYLDACGSLGAVFSSEPSAVASTTTVLAETMPGVCEENSAILDEYLAASGGKRPLFYPAGLTHCRDMKRLLPNHFLDLVDWEVVRHWPNGEMSRLTEGERTTGLAETIANTISGIVRGITSAGIRPLLGLTAGRDTRVIMAACREECSEIEFYTSRYDGDAGAVDQHVARAMIRSLGLNHRWVDIRDVPSPFDDEYQYLTGKSGLTKARFRHSCMRQLSLNRAFLWGPGGEVARAYFWETGDEDRDRISADELVERMHFAGSRAFIGEMEAWLAGVQEMGLLHVLDLAYIEHKHGGWCGPHMYGIAPFQMSVLPFNHRRIHDAMLRLPPSYCRRFELANEVVNARWAELGQFPFNGFMGVRRYVHGIRRRLQKLTKTKG